MTLSEQTEKRVYERLRAFDGLEVAGHEPVDSSIASVLSEGEVLADDGEQYSSIQDAVDASDSWCFVGPGTYYESVTITTDGFYLLGAGYDTLIDGGDVGPCVDLVADDCTVKSLRVTSNSQTGIDIGSQNGTSIIQVRAEDTGGRGINGLSGARDTLVDSCEVVNVDTQGLRIDGERTIVINSYFENNSGFNLNLNGDDGIAANNVLIGGNGLNSSLECSVNDCIIIGNRVHNSDGDGIRVDNGVDPIVANNRVSDSAGTDLNVSATGAVTDANISGASN